MDFTEYHVKMSEGVVNISNSFSKIAKFSSFYCLMTFTLVGAHITAVGKSSLSGLSALLLLVFIYGGLYFYIRNSGVIYTAIKRRKALKCIEFSSVLAIFFAIIICLVLATAFASFAYWRIANDM